jgi:hypothetical protein
VALLLVLVGLAVLAVLLLVYVVGRMPHRALPEDVIEEVSRLAPRRPNQHVVDLETSDGRVIRNVWVAYGRYPAMIGGRTLTQRYRPKEVAHARPAQPKP